MSSRSKPDRRSGHRSSNRRTSVLTWVLIGASLALMTSTAVAGQRWMLVYYRQIGNHVNGSRQTVENHLFYENGSPGAFIGVTNQFNLNSAVWGQSTADGWLRIEPSSDSYRDVRIYNPPVPTDQTPNFYCYNPGGSTTDFSFETHWLHVSDDANITPHPTQPVYHYDLVNGINSSTFVQPPGTESDAFSLTSWVDHIYQTFVVSDGINQIISCKAWGVTTSNYQYVASFHADNGGPISTWPQIGPSATSRWHSSVDFVPVIAHWPLNAVQVTPGQRYALKVRPLGGGGFNSYATNNNNYPDGHLWLENNPVTGRDLCAAVVGLTVGSPSIVRIPAGFTRTITEGEPLVSDAFTIANGEISTQLNYNMTENSSWLSVSPMSGSSTGEPDSISIDYTTIALPAGTHNATITINAPGASNTPQTVTVALTVNPSPYARPDHDEDFDVDGEDFGWFQNCMTGIGVAQYSPACLKARLDGDEDVDNGDLVVFLQCLSGAGVPAVPTCAN